MDIATPTLDPGPATTGRTGVLARVEELTTALAGEVPQVRSASGPAAAAAIDELGALESLVCAAQARQAALAAALPESKGTAPQVGLARRVSRPSRAGCCWVWPGCWPPGSCPARGRRSAPAPSPNGG